MSKETLPKPAKLTDEERDLVHLAFMQGSAALREAGMDAEQARLFITRQDVQAELDYLNHEFKNQEVIFELTKFGVKRNLTRLAPRAVTIFERALEGHRYLKGKNGVIICDERGNPLILDHEPSSIQLKAATEVFDRLDVTAKTDKSPARLNAKILLQTTGDVRIELDSGGTENLTEEQRALSRERVRTAIDKLALDFKTVAGVEPPRRLAPPAAVLDTTCQVSDETPKKKKRKSKRKKK